MTLDRKDVRAKLDPNIHAALVVICEERGLDVGEFIEREIAALVLGLVHDATVLAERTAHLGFSGKNREHSGIGKAGRK
jgi:hypothetical protein